MKESISDLVHTAVFSSNIKKKKQAGQKIRTIAYKNGIYPASTYSLYQAFGQNKVDGFTVPAINLRTLTFDTARTVFEIMLEKQIGPVIFEIARSEIGYTQQSPEEYATCVLAGAIAAGYRGPVFLQGDHYQFKIKNYETDPQTEIHKIKELIHQSIAAGFYNIDIDASTLVDLNKPSLNDQKKNNYQMTALITKYIREIEPKGVTISIGGEIGHIGGKNSTVEEFEAFMKGYLKAIQNPVHISSSKTSSGESKIKTLKIKGISKVSVQTGTSHGGIPLPDGTVAKVNIDFKVLKNIADVSRKKYHLGGPVQHGASTLPDTLFNQFPINKTLEIHLATGFQNIIFDHLPTPLKNQIYSWLKTNFKNEWSAGHTETQFYYKTRKKALGPYKYQFWHLDPALKKTILLQLREKFILIFSQLNLFKTQPVLNRYV